MATAIGQDTVTTIARQHILPSIVDAIYGSNVLFYRMVKANKKMIQGGGSVGSGSVGSVIAGFPGPDSSPDGAHRGWAAAMTWLGHGQEASHPEPRQGVPRAAYPHPATRAPA